jgi:DNA replication and repair protein RecF
MILKRLELKHFRNIHACELQFYPGIHVLYGKNGQGKTNLLESIYYLAITKSFRPAKESQIVEYNRNFFELKAILQGEYEHYVRIYWDDKNKKNVWIDKNKVQSVHDYIGTIPVVLLVPEDMAITRGGPAQRRRYLNLMLSQANQKYLQSLINYNRILRQRNALLQQETIDPHLAEALTIQLARQAEYLIKERIRFIDWLKQYAQQIYNSVSPGDDVVKMHYISTIKSAAGSEEDIIKEWLQHLPAEIEKQRTLLGPHLDDFLIYLNGKPIRYFGSQGENKTMVLTLKVAEYQYLLSSGNKNPILLFDDIFGELDRERIEKMLKLIGTIGQVFVTTAAKELFEGLETADLHFYEIQQGMIREKWYD